jgi:hypothetical protein
VEPLLILAAVFLLYFLPSFIAASRGHQNIGIILALNLTLGWTILGWIGALAWACTAVSDRRSLSALQRWEGKEIHFSREETSEEFRARLEREFEAHYGRKRET